MKNKILISSSIIFASINCFAAKVVQVNADSVVISTEELKAETAKSYVIDLGQGEQCTAALKSTKEGHYLLDTKSCANKEKIRAGQSVTEAIEFAEESVPQKPEPLSKGTAAEGIEGLRSRSRKFKFALTPAVMTNGSLSFSEATASDSGGFYVGTTDYKLDSGVSLKFDFTQSDQNALNFSIGAGYEGSRNLSTATLNFNSLTATGTGTGKISTIFLSSALTYRWQTYYLGLGILVGSVNTDGLPPAVKNLQAGIGADLNMGWFLNENFAIDISSRSFNVTTDRYTSSSGTINLGKGFLNSFNLGLKLLTP